MPFPQIYFFFSILTTHQYDYFQLIFGVKPYIIAIFYLKSCTFVCFFSNLAVKKKNAKNHCCACRLFRIYSWLHMPS